MFDEDAQHVQELIDTYSRRCRLLELRVAREGLNTDPAVRVEIEDIRKIIEDLNQRLHSPQSKLPTIGPSKNDKLKQFFNLKKEESKLRMYLSRHATTTKFPTIRSTERATSKDDVLKNLYAIQIEEAKKESKASGRANTKPFTAVSVLEMIETMYLKDMIEGLRSSASYIGAEQEGIKPGLEVQLEVCPEPRHYKSILRRGTAIFIGGPRANLGTYYYMYGQNVGEMRLGRQRKNEIESISAPETQFECEPHRNLAIIQKCKIGNSKTIFYLAGTGVSGTAAAVAYLRRHWLDELYEMYGEGEFCRIINVARRQDEDISWYISEGWGDDWDVRKY